ncbi:MAG: thioredoxin family protein [Prevotella sp.]|nr:thioredoxin family protein [Prevotella sp.]
MIKNAIVIIVSLLITMINDTKAQNDPVRFTVSQTKISSSVVSVTFRATIEKGWHVYSTALPPGGPTPASLNIELSKGAKAEGGLTFEGNEKSAYDQNFMMTLRFFESSVTFSQKFKITGDDYHIKGYLEYAACNDQMCLPPDEVPFDFKGTAPSASTAAKQATVPGGSPAGEKATVPGDSVTGEKEATVPGDFVTGEKEATVPGDSVAGEKDTLSTTALTGNPSLWAPVIDELKALSDDNDTSTDKSLWYIFFIGILGGLAALFTPCVWPVIPMTVSFFLKRSDNRTHAIRDAITYGIGIIVIYMTLGLAVTAIFGPNAMNALSTNAIVNIFFFLLLVFFALSFFGLFDLTLPSSWSTALDKKASATGGVISIFLMAATLAIVSFSCTGPIIGLLLVDFATSGSYAAPAMGMAGFAVALALPFTIFALFPAMLKKAPKSGAWMNILKVTLGVLELAFALKFLSVADMAYGWGLLSRDTFLTIWVILFALLGLYLTGVVRLPKEGRKRRPWLSIAAGIVSIAFAIYMIPGIGGAPCKLVSAFTPPMSTQRLHWYKGEEVKARFTDYDEAMTAAKKEKKPVLIDFTGYGCVNCRKMEAAVWTDSEVAHRLRNDFILVSLYVDDKTHLDSVMTVTIGNRQRTLRTIGDKWSYLQQHKFGYLAQPFYVIIDANGHPLCSPYTYDEDITKYLNFLNSATAK